MGAKNAGRNGLGRDGGRSSFARNVSLSLQKYSCHTLSLKALVDMLCEDMLFQHVVLLLLPDVAAAVVVPVLVVGAVPTVPSVQCPPTNSVRNFGFQPIC
eukprot:4216068-Amphidinium_carterae.1